ncbi:protein ecdysoneless homolog isoform X2 [Belonocnema kinseyi]|uniref:protein ecdysoneless homolog isoform X2 n=1 Tax=Belonocnema kinseyi TaxID=2817044 RepID=UPI00143DE17F|nr:protein ecdysoneless homolog isoform X2 [Belonocnema kinseyi]
MKAPFCNACAVVQGARVGSNSSNPSVAVFSTIVMKKYISCNLSDQIIPHIHATLRFDEDVGDEWFIVFLIYNLTKAFGGLIARISDSDGEFLLIEAANFLPPWANPETCQMRVFVLNESIHVILDKHKPLIDILNSLCHRPNAYKLSEEVQSIIRKRISVYPEEIKERVHKAKAYLPEKAAAMFQHEAGLIAPAIRMLFHSDPFERKVCRGMKYFPPEQRVMVNVKMTKCLYAMVVHCRYTGDPMTGWNLPPVNSPTYNAHLLGVKIACGLEMLVARAHEELRKRKNDENNISNNEGLPMNNKKLNSYISQLELCGYFKGLLKDSQEREKLLKLAKDYFVRNSSSSELINSSLETEADRALKLWKNVQTNDVEIQAQEESTLSPADSDSWLIIDEIQLDKLLGERWDDRSSKGHKQSSQNLRGKVQDFLSEKTDVEGVQLFGDGETKSDVEDNGRIEFDTDVFDSTLQDILDLVVPGGDGEFDDSSEGSLGGDGEDTGEMDKYINLLDAELRTKQVMGDQSTMLKSPDKVELNLMESLSREAGGSGPTGNIIGGPIQKLMHLKLQSPSTVPPDLQS